MYNSSDRQAQTELATQQELEAKLQACEQFLHSIYYGSANGIFVVDVLPSGEFRFAGLNPAYERLTGLRLEDIKDKSPEQVLPAAVAAAVSANYGRCAQAGTPISYEECTFFIGEESWWLTTLTPLFDPQSRIYQLTGTTINITKHKQIEEERDREAAERHRLFQQIEQQNQTLEAQVQKRTAQLKQTNEQLLVENRERQRLIAQVQQQAKTLDTVLSASPDEFYMFDRAGHYLYANRPALQAISVVLQRQEPLELSDIVGLTGRDLGFPLKLVKPHETRLEGVFVTGEPLRGEMSYPRQNDIRHRDYIITPLCASDGSVERVVVTSRDISERKQAELALQESKQHIANILASITDAFIALDREWKFTYLNRQAERLLNRTRKELLGKNVWGEFPETMNSKFYREYHKVISERVSTTFEEFYQPLKCWFEVRAYPAQDGLGIYFRNITKRKQAEAKIQSSLLEKETLLKEIHHRVKNNLQIISSLLRLQSRQIQDIQTLELFKESQNRVQAMALIHEKLYQSSNLAQIDFQQYITTLVKELFRSYDAHRRGISFRVNINALEAGLENISTTGEITYKQNPPLLAIDTAIPCGLMINELVSNSLKYAFPENRSGEICINLQFGELQLISPIEKYQFILTIRDNGIGLPKAFDFRNTKSLGLQLVCRLTKQIGGSIQLNCSQGTEFKIAFANPIYQ